MTAEATDMKLRATWLRGLQIAAAGATGIVIAWATALLALLVAGLPIALVLGALRQGFSLPAPPTGEVFKVLHPLLWMALAPLHIGQAARWIARRQGAGLSAAAPA